MPANMPSVGLFDGEAGSEFDEFLFYGGKEEEKWRQNGVDKFH